MAGAPHCSHLRLGAMPYVCHIPAPVHKHWEVEAKAQLEEDIRIGDTEPVPASEVTLINCLLVRPWNAVPKWQQWLRKVANPKALQTSSKLWRETHHTQAPFDMVSGGSGSLLQDCY